MRYLRYSRHCGFKAKIFKFLNDLICLTIGTALLVADPTLDKILGLAIHGQAEDGEAHRVASLQRLIISPWFAIVSQGSKEFIGNIKISARQ